MFQQRLNNLPKGNALSAYVQNMGKLFLAKKLRLSRVPLPDTVMLEATNYCQLQCAMCAREYKYGKEMDIGHMDITKAKFFIDSYGIYFNRIGLTGLGEPLLYPHLAELAAYIKGNHKGISLFISMNAQLTNILKTLNDVVPYIDTIQVSLDGIGNTYDKIRKRGMFQKVENTIKALISLQKSYSFHIKINSVIYEDNYTHMSEIIRYAHTLNIQEVVFNTINQVSFDKPKFDEKLYTNRAFTTEYEKTQNTAQKYGIEFYFPKMKSSSSFSLCPYLWGQAIITWDGYLVPCCAKPFPKELHFGNVFDTPLQECMNNAKYVNFRKLHMVNQIPKFCRNCHYTIGTREKY